MTLHPPHRHPGAARSTEDDPRSASTDAGRVRRAGGVAKWSGLARLALATAICGYGVLTLWPLPAAAAEASRGSGRVVSEPRALPAFDAVSMAGDMELVLRQGSPQSVQVEADDNLLVLLQTEVVSGRGNSGGTPTLQIRWAEGASLRGRSTVRVTVVVPSLSALALSGSGDARITAMRTPRLQLSLAGSGDLRAEALDAGELDVRLAGSGDLSANGSATRLDARLAGSGDLRLSGLRVDDAKVRLAGSGDVDVQALKTLDAEVAGSGDVSYRGDPTVRSRVIGSGTVKRSR